MMEQSLCEQQVTRPGEEGPVTVGISRRVKPGFEQQYETWVSGITEAALSFPGHLGTNVLRPGPSTNHEYVQIYRFDNYRHCRDWEQSGVRREWLDKLEGMIEGEPVMRRGTGLEFWFDLPELPVQKHPSPHKMAIVLITVVYSLVLMFNIVLSGWLEGMPLWQRVLVIVVLQVLLMTYLVMPRVTRLLKGWLYK